MGQAKQRGNYEQRVEQAKLRDASLAVTFKNFPDNHPVSRSLKKVGLRKTVLRAIQCGILRRIDV